MSKIWSKEETLWSFALYGTAVGAGTLFLPIQLGSAGAVVLFITALVAYPFTYWPHKALCQFILSAKTKGSEGITGAVTYYYGKKIGNLITRIIKEGEAAVPSVKEEVLEICKRFPLYQ